MRDLELAKIPPSNIDVEQVVLGTILNESHTVDHAMGLLRVNTFYKSEHQLIFSAIRKLYQEGKPVDILTVTEYLHKDKVLDAVGGASYITLLSNRVASGENIEAHIRIIQEQHMKRQVIASSNQLQMEAFDPSTDALVILDKAQKSIEKNALVYLQSDFKKASEIYMDSMKSIEEAMSREDHIIGLPTGMHNADMVLSGLQDTHFIVIASRPGMGKTALMNTIALCNIHQKNPIGIFSLEMSAQELMTRMISSESKMNSYHLKSGRLTDNEYHEIGTHTISLYQADDLLFIDDTAYQTINQIRAKAKLWVRKYGVKMIFIDYMQLCAVEDKMNREQQIATIARTCKLMAKELNIPVDKSYHVCILFNSTGFTKV
jgi:replicative DNA helicase